MLSVMMPDTLLGLGPWGVSALQGIALLPIYLLVRRTTGSILVTEQKGSLTESQKHSLPLTSSCLPPQGQAKEVGNNLSKAVVEPGAINLTLQEPPGY